MTLFPMEVQEKKPLDIDIHSFLETSNKEEVLSAIKDFSQQESEDWFKLGGILSYYRINKPEEDWLGLVDYAEEHFQIKRRTTYYLVSIYDSLTASEISFEQVKSIGWTKLKEVAPLLTKDNVDYWVGVAATKTTKEIISLLKSPATTNSTMAIALDDHLDSEPVVTPTLAPIADSAFMVEELPIPTKPVMVNDKPEVIEVIYSAPAETDYIAKVESVVVESVLAPEVQEEPTTVAEINTLAENLKGYDLDMVLSTVNEVFPHVQIVVKDLVGD